MHPPTTTLDEIKKCALWALLIGGSTSVLGIWLEIDLAYSGWLGMVVLVALVWPVQLIIGLCSPCIQNNFSDFLYANFDHWFWVIPQIGIYFVLILMLRWILRKLKNYQDEST